MKLILIVGVTLIGLLMAGSSDPSSVSKNQNQQSSTAWLELLEQQAQQQSAQTQQMAELQEQWQAERTRLDEQRDLLEVDRQQLAQQRIREPVIAHSIEGIGLLALSLLPLVVSALLLAKSNRTDEENVIAETLMGDLMSNQPRLFGSTEK
ncbi:MAG: hypothetical protein FJ267_20510 [Planctomycetes bacterium]|nr:hypothetical protein [Planctomycetota bacterium]